jgi:hypothetical protein
VDAVTTASGRLRALLIVAGVGQLLWYLVSSAFPGGALNSCVPAVGRLARAGLELAWLSVPGGCAQAAQADARNLAVAAIAAALPLVLPHAFVTVVAALCWEWLAAAHRAVERAVRMVLPALPRLRTLMLEPARVAVAPERPLRCIALLPQVISRRGPPAVAPA